jgi:hypothetical protein
VRQARAVVIAFGREEHLRLVLEPAERLAVNDAVAVALERGTDVIFLLRPETSTRPIALRRLRCENLMLALFQLFADSQRISPRKLVPFARGPTLKISATV